MKKHIRIAAALLAAVMIATALAVFSFAAEEDELVLPSLDNAPHVYLYNFENDRVILEKGDHRLPVFPAATVKMMTAITAIEALNGDYSATTTVSAEMLSRIAGNRVGFKEGEVVSAGQMLAALIVNGANDAAVILSYMIAGGVEAFVSMMNEKAFELGARSTVYTNPTGLHDDAMYTTVADTVTIAKYAYGLPVFMEYAGMAKYPMAATNLVDQRNIYNRNCLISKYYRPEYYYERAIGMSAGSTVQAGFSVVAAAKSSDGTLTYLCVIMGAETLPGEAEGDDSIISGYVMARELFSWVFKAYGYRRVLSDKAVLCELPVELSSTADYVTLVPAQSVDVFMPMDVDIEKEVKISSAVEDSTTAPVTKGQVLGKARVIYGGEELGRVDLVATAEVARSEFLYALERISNFTSSGFFISAVVTAIVLSVAYVLFTARMRQRRLRSRVPRRR